MGKTIPAYVILFLVNYYAMLLLEFEGRYMWIGFVMCSNIQMLWDIAIQIRDNKVYTLRIIGRNYFLLNHIIPQLQNFFKSWENQKVSPSKTNPKPKPKQNPLARWLRWLYRKLKAAHQSS